MVVSSGSAPGARAMTRPRTGEHAFELPSDLAGERLDRALVTLLGPEGGFSRSRLQAWVKEGRVRVDGALVAKPNHVLEAGARLVLDVPEAAPARDVEGRDIQELAVLHEDEAIVVLDKPAGLLVHPTDRLQEGTLVHLVRERFGELPEVQGEDRPGIVHRLDRLTSGVMVLGRTPEALAELKRQFAEREVEKEYLALCHHVPRFDSEWIEAPIEPDPKHRDRFRVAHEEGRAASTFIECRETFRGFSHIAAFPKTGRTHQIRVHLAHLGLPIVGDRVYRHPGALREPIPPEAPPVARQMLHARALAFRHPATGERVKFESAPADDVVAFLTWLREERQP